MIDVTFIQLAVALIVVPIAYYLFFRWQPRYFSKLGVSGPFPLPVLGNMYDVISKGLVGTDLEYAKKYGQVIGVFEGTMPVLLVANPDMLQQIFIKDFNIFTDRRAIIIGDPVTDNFLTALKGNHWRHVRHLMTPTFSAGKLKKMTAEINDCAMLLVKNLSESAAAGKIVNMRDRCGDFTMDAIARTAFGIQIDTQNNPNSPFVVYAKKLFTVNFARPAVLAFFFFPFLRPLLKRYKFSIFPADSTEFFKEAVKKAIESRKEEASPSRTDFLQLMLNAHNDNDAETETVDTASDDNNAWSGSNETTREKRGLTENEVIAQSMLFLLAGYETTASAVSFVTYCLALNPDCQERLHNEVVKVTGDKSTVDYETVNSLTYMDKCIHETLRLYPAAIRTDRETTKDTQIAGIPIPKGLYVSVPIYAIHHNSRFWPDPEKFDPERFSPEARASHHPMQYLPFGMGPRACIGMRLALFEIKIALVHLVKAFRFVRCEETDVPLKFTNNGLLQPKNGIKLKLELRSDGRLS